MRIPSGVPGFDTLVEGGFPSGSAVVVQGPGGKDKDAFLFQFVLEGLRGTGSVLVVLSSLSPARYMRELRDAGIDVDRVLAENRLRFVDWFAYKEEAVQDVEQDGPVFRASIDLANVGIAISRAIAGLPREGEKRAAIEILSPALSVYDLPNVYGFAQSTKAKLERFGFTSLFVVEKEMHDERTLSSLSQPFEGVVDIDRAREGDEIVRKIAVLSLKDTASESKYVPIELGTDRILRVSTVSERERTLRRQEEMIKGNPKDPKLWLATARNLKSMGENDRALKCVEAALNLDPKDVDGWRLKAEVLDALGRKDEAEMARVRAAGTPAPKPDDASARILAVVEQRLRQDPRDTDALFAKAAAHAKGGNLAAAVDALDTLALIDDAYPGLWVLKAKLHARRGEPAKAQQSRQRALEIEKRQQAAAERARAKSPPVEETAFECPECGAMVGEHDSTCPSCGVQFESAEAAQARETLKPKPEIAPRGLTNGLAREAQRGVGRVNGLVNGTRTRASGLVDGTRGRTNGLVNGTRGRTNGLVNGTRGRTNGLVNGTRGRTNGLVNGTRGRTNGLVNGTRGRTNGVTNGLVNGLLSLRSGMTNGLTNGSGFTNGLGSGRLRQEMKLRKWKLYAIPAVLVILLLVPLLGPVSTTARPISIDGSFADWAGGPVLTEGARAGVPPNVDIVGFGVRDNVDSLAFYLQVNGTALMGGGNPPSVDTIRIFLDLDRNASTGYFIDGYGADRLIELSGWNGAIQARKLFEWDSTRSSLDWSGWIKGAEVSAAVGGARVEAEVAWYALVGPKSSIAVVFHATAFDGATDSSSFAVSPVSGSVRVQQTSVAPEIIAGTNVPLLRLDLAAELRDVSYDAINVTLEGTAPVTAVSAIHLVDGVGTDLGVRIPVSERVSFQFPPRTLPRGASEQLFVVIDTASNSGQTLGARIELPQDVDAGASVVTTSWASATRDVGYLGNVPANVVIDGGFSEWTTVRTDSTVVPGLPAHIDVSESAYYLNAQWASAYLRVIGPMMQGVLVPAASVPATAPGPSAPDADRDGVPDAVDPLPNDFNNDGVNDPLTGNDYDGDTILDYPSGPDYFLNTTIPASFPAAYANHTVSVFIGPNSRPVTTGEDIARAYVDADNDTATGFRIDAIGADYLAEVVGKHGMIVSRALQGFAGASQLEWRWTTLEALPAAVDSSRLELSFDVSARGFTNASRAFFDLRDWTGRTDSGQPATVRIGTRGAQTPTTRDISGNQKWFFRDTATTGTLCTTNRAASTTAGSSATSTVLSSTQSICWFTPLGQPATTIAGAWEVILDIDKTTDATRVVVPDANGDTNAWTTSGCTEANEYQCIDETTNDGDTTHIVSTAVTVTDSLFNFPAWSSPPSPLSIVNVIVEASCRKVASPAVDARVIVKSGSTTGVGTTSIDCANSGTYTVWTDTWTTDPADASAWTLSDVDALQIGVRDNDDKNREVRVSHVKVTITFLPVYSVEIDKCLNEACTSLTTLYGPTTANSFGSDVTLTTGSIGAQSLGASERFRFRIQLTTSGSVTVRYNGANPGTDDSRATVPIPEFEEIALPLGVTVAIAWFARRRKDPKVSR
ncbi:MAG TPA: ATPase domain-containing protein [Thermoplasmata archaeon]|nr:ATPase domain-containing protein [Thermoplasmata archaeon]